MGLSATDITRLEERRTTVILELNSLSVTAAGGTPNTSGIGAVVDMVGYKKSLYEELQSISEMLSSGAAVGGFEEIFEVSP